MKEIRIAIRINDDRIATILKTIDFDKESIEGILLMIGMFENLKQEQINKLENLGRRA